MADKASKRSRLSGSAHCANQIRTDAISNTGANPFCVRGTPALRYSMQYCLPPLWTREEYPSMHLDETRSNSEMAGAAKDPEPRKLKKQGPHYTSTWRLSIIESREKPSQPPEDTRAPKKLPSILRLGAKSKPSDDNTKSVSYVKLVKKPSRRPDPPASPPTPWDPPQARASFLPPVEETPLVSRGHRGFGGTEGHSSQGKGFPCMATRGHSRGPRRALGAPTSPRSIKRH